MFFCYFLKEFRNRTAHCSLCSISVRKETHFAKWVSRRTYLPEVIRQNFNQILDLENIEKPCRSYAEFAKKM